MTNNNIRLVGLDLDGTLVGWPNRVHHKDRSAIRFLQAQKVPLVFASGRTFDHMMFALNRAKVQLTHRDFVVAKNGGLIYQCNGQRSIKQLVFSKSLVNELVLASEKYKLSVFGYGYLGSNIVVRNARLLTPQIFIWKVIRGLKKRLVRYDSARPVPVTKLIIAGRKKRIAQFVTNFLTKQKLVFYPALEFFYHVIDVAPFAASKQNAMSEICQLTNVLPQEVMFVGDGHNDISALKWAGVSIAMGNAEHVVKATAQEVTTSVKDAGFARAVATHFKEFSD